MIQSLDDIATSRIRECAEQAAADYRASVRPIYGLDGGRLEHVGSCLLLNIHGRRVLSTAAHIADWLAKNRRLFVLGLIGTHPVEIAGRVRATIPPMGVRNWDHLDCAFWEVPADAAAAMGPVEFISMSRMSQNRTHPQGRVYTAIGCLVSRNEDSIDEAGSISVRKSMYKGQLIDAPPPSLISQLPGSGDIHLLLKFGREAYTTDGESISTFNPTGFSGGALLDLGDFTQPGIYARSIAHSAMLSGMLVEHWPQYDVMSAVKIGPIVEGIRRQLVERAAPT